LRRYLSEGQPVSARFAIQGLAGFVSEPNEVFMVTNVYLEEYESQQAVPKYVSGTAGAGIAYVLENVYGPIYADLLDKMSAQAARDGGFRILEYGCGGGMNLLWIVRHVLQKGQPLALACGTDFSSKMVAACEQEVREALHPRDLDKVCFRQIANENLVRELPKALKRETQELLGSFHLIIGVNTFRYCFRLGNETDSTRGIYSLLRPGGYTVMIEMNHNFPLFRSRLRRDSVPKEQRYLPTLEQYAGVFRHAGFELQTVKNFCWIPHSASSTAVALLGAASPLLQTLFARFATRSLIVGRKPQ
jgi:SAM-dependent methyltransferase